MLTFSGMNRGDRAGFTYAFPSTPTIRQPHLSFSSKARDAVGKAMLTANSSTIDRAMHNKTLFLILTYPSFVIPDLLTRDVPLRGSTSFPRCRRRPANPQRTFHIPRSPFPDSAGGSFRLPAPGREGSVPPRHPGESPKPNSNRLRPA